MGLQYDPQTALIVVDVQNDFADPAAGCAWPAARTSCPVDQPRGRAAPGRAARSSSTPRTGTRASTPHFAKDGGIWPVHCVAGHVGRGAPPGASIVDGPIVRKGANGEDGYSGFTMRDPTTGEDDRRPSSRRCSAPHGVAAGRRRRPGDRLLREGDGARRASGSAIRATVLDRRDPGGRPGRRRRRPGAGRDGRGRGRSSSEAAR